MRWMATPLVAVGLLCLLPFAAGVRVDNRLELWIEASDGRETYDRYRDVFGSDEYVVLMYRGAAIFSEEGLEAQMAALEAMEKIEGVGQIMSLPGVYRDLYGAEDREEFEADVLGTPFYKRVIVSEAGDAGAYLLQVHPGEAADSRARLVRQVRQASEGLQQAGYAVHFSGPTALNAVLDETSQSAAMRTFPPAVALSLLALALLFRSVSATVAAAACGGLAVGGMTGLMGLGGYSFNMASSALPALVWVLALSNLVQLVRHFQSHLAEGMGREAACARAYGETVRATVLSGVTNAAGFFSLITATMTPIQELGVIAAMGLLLSLVINLTLLPWMLRVLPAKARALQSFDARWPGWVAEQSTRHPVAVNVVFGLLAVGLVASIPFIKVESNPLRFLPEDSETLRDYAAISESVAGFYSMEIPIELPMAWTEPGAWEALDEAARKVAGAPGVSQVLSPLDVLRKLRHWDSPPESAVYALPESGDEARRLLEQLPTEMRPMLEGLVSEDGRMVRLTAFVNVMNSKDFEPITAAAGAAVDGLPDGWRGAVTGLVVELVHSQLALVDAQVRSFGSALLVIVIIMAVGLRSWRLAAAALPQNLFPILSAFGFMAVANVPLDAATVTMAGVALGIAVDDTLHYMSTWKRLRREGVLRPEETAAAALRETGSGMATSSIAACVGFLMMTVSTFVPLAWFGIVCAVALGVGMVADLALTPALTLVLDRKGWMR